MKKPIVVLLVVALAAVVVVFWLADKGNNPAVPTPLPPIRDEPASDGVEPRVTLKVQYPPGQFQVTYEDHSTSTVTIEGRNDKGILKKRRGNWYETAIWPPDANGITRIVSCMRRGVYYRSPCPGQAEVDLDTDRPTTLESNPAGEIMKLKLAKLTMLRLNRNLAVVDMKDGDDSYIEACRSIVPEADTILAKNRKLIAKLALPGCGRTRNYLPSRPVGAGAGWYAEFDTKVKAVAKKWHTLAKCTLAKFTEADGVRLATIDYVKRERIEPVNLSVAGMNVNGGEMTVDGSGRIVIEVDTGLVRSHTVKETKTGQVSGQMLGQDNAVNSTVERERNMTATRLPVASQNRR